MRARREPPLPFDRRRTLEVLATALLWCALAGLATAPLLGRITDGTPAGENDLFQNQWNFWWWKTALSEGRSPYETDRIHRGAEETVSLAFHTHSEANVFLGAPVLALLGPTAALGVMTVFAFALSGFGAWLLAFELTRRRDAAWIAGLVFAFFPQHFEQSLEHLGLAAYGAMPLVLWGLVRGVRTGSRRAWVFCAIAFTTNALFSWHNALLILPTALACFAFELALSSRSRVRVLLEASLAGLLATVMLAPFAWPMLREILAGETYFQKPRVDRALDLYSFLVPSSQHPLWGGALEETQTRLSSYRAVGSTGYVGLAALGILLSPVVAWGLARGRARAPARRLCIGQLVLFSTLLVLHLVLALGDRLRVGGTTYELSLPFTWLAEAPLLSTLRVANRFLVPAMLALAVLVAASSSYWLERLEDGRGRGPSRGLAVAFLALLLLDTLWLPYPVRTMPTPEWTRRIEDLPPGSLLNIPGGHRARAAEDMYLQTLHGRAIVGGYVSCTPPSVEAFVARHPVLRTIHEAERSPSHAQHTLEPGLRDLLADARAAIAVVVVHLDRSREAILRRREAAVGAIAKRLENPEKGNLERTIEEARRAMRAIWGEPVFADATTEVFARPR